MNTAILVSAPENQLERIVEIAKSCGLAVQRIDATEWPRVMPTLDRADIVILDEVDAAFRKRKEVTDLQEWLTGSARLARNLFLEPGPNARLSHFGVVHPYNTPFTEDVLKRVLQRN